MLEAAYELAVGAHEGQVRKGDGSPYVGHSITVARLCREAGSDEPVVAAALLHDVVEDAEIGLEEIERRFGADVGALVDALTEDQGISDYAERKAAHRAQVEAAGSRAATIYTADKLANLRDMRELYSRVGERAAERFTAPLDLRARLWEEDLEMASGVAPELVLLEELRSELAGFRSQRAGRRAGQASLT